MFLREKVEVAKQEFVKCDLQLFVEVVSTAKCLGLTKFELSVSPFTYSWYVSKCVEVDYSFTDHATTFDYPDGSCFMRCECGWNAEITSYPNPWVVIEVKTRFKEHLNELGIDNEGDTND